MLLLLGPKPNRATKIRARLDFTLSAARQDDSKARGAFLPDVPIPIQRHIKDGFNLIIRKFSLTFPGVPFLICGPIAR